MKRRARRLLVASASIAAISYVGCSKEQEPIEITGNIMPPPPPPDVVQPSTDAGTVTADDAGPQTDAASAAEDAGSTD